MSLYYVTLQCPSCQHTWHAATIDSRWGKAYSPAMCAKQSYCVSCGQKPPMRVVEQDVLSGLEATA